MLRCFLPAAAGVIYIRRRWSGSSGKPLSGLALKEESRPTGYVTGHGTHALERGAPIHLVQATLGHASVATTGRYLHARPTDSSSSYLAV
jgi:integrase